MRNIETLLNTSLLLNLIKGFNKFNDGKIVIEWNNGESTATYSEEHAANLLETFQEVATHEVKIYMNDNDFGMVLFRGTQLVCWAWAEENREYIQSEYDIPVELKTECIR